ncbi:MAG: ATP synthase F1 subunit epsilon [Sandaracinaceae bacterium]
MADPLLTLEIATPLGLRLETQCESLAAPSVQGEFGVFPGHLPLLAALRSGVVSYVVDGADRKAAVGPGFIEAGPERVLLLTDSFALAEDVDADAVKSSLEDAEKRLDGLETEYAGTEYDEIQRDIEWAHAQLELVG